MRATGSCAALPPCLGEVEPERVAEPAGRVVWHLLDGAVRALQEAPPAWSKGPRSHTARAWILADDTDWPLSFVNACALLGVDAGRLRRELGLAD